MYVSHQVKSKKSKKKKKYLEARHSAGTNVYMLQNYITNKTARQCFVILLL